MTMFPRWRSGQRPRLNAAGWNAAMLAAEAHQRKINGFQDGEGGRRENRSFITVRNNTAGLQSRSSVLGLDQPTFDPTTRLDDAYENLCLDAITPQAGVHEDKFVVLPDPLDKQEIGDAVIDGMVLVAVNVTDTGHKFATIDNNNTANLKSANFGRGRILWSPGTTGIVPAFVLLGGAGISLFRGLTDADINKGSTPGNVKRYKDGTNTDSGIVDSVYNDFADVGHPKVVIYVSIGGNFYLIACECPLK